MKTLRRRILALPAALPILLGLLVPAAAMPCAADDRGRGRRLLRWRTLLRRAS